MKKQPPKTASIWTSGVNQALDALRGEGVRVREIALARTDQRIQEIVEEAGRKGIPIRRETKDGLSALVGHAHHQGVAVCVEEYVYTSLETVTARPVEEREPLVVLDSIQDPQNLGAVIRSSCFLGAKGVVIPKDRSVRVTGTVIKVAAGATAYVPVIEVTNLARALDELKDAGLWIVGLDVQGDRSIHEADLTVPLALVIGSEQKGMRSLIRKQCDLLVKIPARGPIQSLNAATACAIALAEVQRQRAAAS
jgi:23S rRNA (guanosine2251-2'-O)-methyltransferase